MTLRQWLAVIGCVVWAVCAFGVWALCAAAATHRDWMDETVEDGVYVRDLNVYRARKNRHLKPVA